MVNAHADGLSNCLELIKRMFFVLYSKQQNVFLPRLDEVLENLSLTLALVPFFLVFTPLLLFEHHFSSLLTFPFLVQ